VGGGLFYILAQHERPEEYISRVLRFLHANLSGKKRAPRRKSASKKAGG